MSADGFATFEALARKGTVVPVWREVLADMLTPVGAFGSVVGGGAGFLLESVEHGERWSRFSFLGRRPVATLVASGGRVAVPDGRVPAGVPLDSGVLACLEALLGAHRSPEVPGLPPLHGGLVGYLGYDVVREIERLGPPPPDDQGLPDAVFCVIGEIVAFDHWRQRAVLLDNVVVGPDGVGDTAGELRDAYEASEERLESLRRDLAAPPAEPLCPPPARRETPRRGTCAAP